MPKSYLIGNIFEISFYTEVWNSHCHATFLSHVFAGLFIQCPCNCCTYGLISVSFSSPLFRNFTLWTKH